MTTKTLDAILILVLLLDIAVQLLRWRASRAKPTYRPAPPRQPCERCDVLWEQLRAAWAMPQVIAPLWSHPVPAPAASPPAAPAAAGPGVAR